MSESELYRFTKEEWAEHPYMIELRGGRSDGKRFTLPGLPWIWRVPEPLGIVNYSFEAVDPSRPPEMPITNYRRTGRVTDDGAHIYERQR